MWTSRASARRSGVAALLLAVLLPGLSSCAVFDGEGASDSGVAVAADTTAQVRDLLARHARAVRGGDMSRFLADVDASRLKFAARQKRYFLNLRELPIGRFGYRVPEGGVTQVAGGGVRAVVEMRMQLKGYDAVPVLTPQLLTFTRTEDGALRLANDRDREFARRNDLELAPWDLTRIEVEERDGVLGIFDEKSVDAAYQIMPAVRDGIAVIDRTVPVKWSQRVVVYALSNVRVLADLDNLPGGDPDALDGVAFPVRAGPRSTTLASTRFMLHPRMIDRNDGTRDRLIRHELTHVALGLRDDHVPTWLSEGLAEHVSVEPIPAYRRLIARAALTEARAGVTRLPADRTFNGPGSGAHYGVAWFACEYVAATYGEDALWRLFDAMRAGDGTRQKGQDAVLEKVLGIDSSELAEAAGQKIVTTFG